MSAPSLLRSASVAGLALALLLCAGHKVAAQSTPIYPTWWASQGILSGTTPNDFAAANQGQAKNMALGAVNELNSDLAQFGGAGDTLNELAISLTATSAQTSDFTAINLGQLKALAQPFYDRLLTVGYTLGPLTTGTYPWIGNGLAPNDFAAANIGQLKYLFSFDVTYSSTGDGIPDWWAQKYFPGRTISSGSFAQWSGGQVTYLQAYQQGLNPIDYYNGHTPTLSIVSGNNQTGSPGGYAPAPLIVSLADGSGRPLVGAPVIFAVTSGSGQIRKSYMSPLGNSVALLTDQNGQAKVFFLLPGVTGASSQITATPGSGSYSAQAVFTESTDNGGGTYPSPFAPSNGSVVLNADGSLDISWQNNTDDPSDIPVSLEQPDGSWKVVATVPAGTTTVHIPPRAFGWKVIERGGR